MDYQKAIDHILDRLDRELPASLKYHSVDHTKDVMRSARHIATAEGIEGKDMNLLMTAAAYHDSGFLRTYARHEEVSCEIAGECLPLFGFNAEEIAVIQAMIMSTRVPQASDTHLGRILCDADLDYLGDEHYTRISQGLYDELILNGFTLNHSKWLDIQIKFLEGQQYWTEYSKAHRSAKKKAVLMRLIAEKEALG